MEFEYDPNKSASNKAKHGIDFEEAQALWDDPQYIVDDSYSKDNEQRFVATGRIGDKMWTAAFTMRGNRVRLISVRRARVKEVEHYDEYNC